MNLCIIGAGISGLLLILLLAETSIPLNSIYIIDPHFDGGDLFRKWSSVISNTPWSVTITNLQTHLPSVKIPKWALALPLDKPTPVFTIAKLIRECAEPLLKQVKCVYGSAVSANWSSKTSKYTVLVQKEQSTTLIEASGVCLTYGSEPKELDISIPSIPLDIALDCNRLSKYIEPDSKVIVFGTRHSGVHVLKNLVDCSANSIIGLYKGVKPFMWARDGEYDGIKMDAALIADEIIAGKYPSVQLLSTSNLSAILREVRSAHWVVYAIGFEPRNLLQITNDGVPITKIEYDNSGKILNCSSMWGFGIAYPSQAPDGIHWDVGVSSFLEHIHGQTASIVSIIYAIQ